MTEIRYTGRNISEVEAFVGRELEQITIASGPLSFCDERGEYLAVLPGGRFCRRDDGTFYAVQNAEYYEKHWPSSVVESKNG